jgi:type IV pilus assembly protein PilQ
VNDQGLISVRVQDASINDLLFDAALKTNHRYFLYTPVEGKVSTYIDNVNFEEFITYLFSGTDYSGVKDEGVYFIGKRNQEILRTTELVKLEHRTIETVVDFIPSELKKGVEIKEFIELNGLILSGSRPNIAEIKRFLASIDQVVPVVKIDVLIVDVTKNATIEAGIDMSLGGDNVPDKTSGKLNPGLDMTVNSSSINEIIRAFNGMGVVNLGQVTSDFYANIKALEANGVLKLRSTPMLATLNGHEAELSIGNTEYYLETQANTITSQTPIQQQSQQFKPVNADLTVNIKPIVSSGDNVTLEISVSQSDFTARIGDTGPPGSVDRNFKSYIRVLNGEMILLGGLEEKSKEDSGSGLPLLSRIPVIKWLFSSRTKTTRKSQLNIFIRPTVIYQ